eukprot:TRINITY_DN8141_c0_g1_i1.p1 TRINITY_DN8141_c0_g1~~TRINITY_DN8141_c0_g1_i1.p1  ORF type:complete len:487 (+),score=97.80 TRINITY_DN8141_c0_g1_i1:176-1636(+)
MDATIFFFFERLQTDKRLFAWLQSNSGRLKRETTVEIVVCYILSVITARLVTFPLLRLKTISQTAVSTGPRGGARPWYLGAFSTAIAILPNALIQLLLYCILRIIFAQEIEIGVDGIVTDEEKEEEGGTFFRSLWNSSQQRKKNKRREQRLPESQSLPSASSIQRRQWFSSPPTLSSGIESHSLSSSLPALGAPLTPVSKINLSRIVRRVILLHLIPKLFSTVVLFPISVFQTRAIMGQITLPDLSSFTRSEWLRLSWGHLIPKLYRKVFKERKLGKAANPFRPALISRVAYVAAWILIKEILFDKLLKMRTLSLQLNRSSSVPSLTSLEHTSRRRREHETEVIKARKEVSVSVSSMLTLDYFAGLLTQCVLFPWDVITTNQQLNTNAGKGILSIFRSIRELGPSSWRYFFRGLGYHFLDSLMMYFVVLFVFSNSRIMFNRIKIAIRARRRRLKRAQREYIKSQTKELLSPPTPHHSRGEGEEEQE